MTMNEFLPTDNTKQTKRCEERTVTIAKIFVSLLLLAGIGAVVVSTRKASHTATILNEIETQSRSRLQQPSPDDTRSKGRNKKSYIVTARAPPTSKGPWQNIRLPRSVVPERYELNLDVDMVNDTFSGHVRILINVTGEATSAVKYVLIHKADIKVHSVRILELDGTPVSIKTINEYKPNEYLVIEMYNALTTGSQYHLECKFEADLRTDLAGLFVTQGKANSKIAATFLSPVSTRKVFPCFDDPDFKATFKISVTHDAKYNVLSNMPEETRAVARNSSINNNNNRTITTFKESLRMSTFTIGLLVADDTFKVVQRRMLGSLVIQVWDFEGTNNWNKSTNQLVALLDYYEKHFFQLPFPLEKLDVAILPDYIPGAMETWGLMMFRVRLNKYHLVAHELVHQWFGNLATMEFWDEAWIKEGFAQYLATIVGDIVDPSQRLKDNIFNLMSLALPMDSYASSHSIVPEIRSPTDIRNVYDNIVYYKGEPIVHILSSLVGKANFRKGMKHFLQRYQYKNAKQDDLFQVMSEVSGIDVKTFMDPWLLQMGYPLLNVHRINSTHIEVEQERFSLDSPDTVIKPSPYNYQWSIIVTYRSLEDTEIKQHVMTGKKKILAVPDNTILNPGHMQYYRIHFSRNTTHQVKTQLVYEKTRFTINDRVGIISDMFFGLQARKIKLIDVVEFIDYLKHEKDQAPWNEVIKILTKVHDLTKDTDKLRHLWDNSIVQPYVEKAYQQFPFSENMIKAACYLNNSKVINQAKAFANRSASLNEIVCCALRHDESAEQRLWHRFHNLYLTNPKQRTYELSYLACTMNKTQLSLIFEHTMNLAHTKPGDATYFLNRMMRSDLARDVAWNFIQLRWPDYIARYSNNVFLLKELILSIVPLFRTTTELHRVEAFYNKVYYTLGTGRSALEQAISVIKMHIELNRFVENELRNAGKDSFKNPFQDILLKT